MDGLDPAEYLPAELFHKILSYLDGSELARTTRVSKVWNTLGADGVLWQSLCRSRWHGKRYMKRVYRIGISRFTVSYIKANDYGFISPKNGSGRTDKPKWSHYGLRRRNQRLWNRTGSSPYYLYTTETN